MKKIHVLFYFIPVLLIFACQKEDFITSSSATLQFSTDTIQFDTVFTTFGSTTKQLKVYNPHKEWIKISEIYLGGGDASFFRMAIDGEPARSMRDVEIAPDDSMYIFIEVTIDPNDANSPLVVSDSIIFITNGNRQDVKLEAWGQDVFLLRGNHLQTQTWTNEKPYLIIDSVVIDSQHTLTIPAGAVIYFHKQAVMLVNGSLEVQGELNNPVLFRGDRLDDALSGLPYDKLPEQWGGLLFNSMSKGNNIRYAGIRNGIIGLYAFFGATINIENSVIDNQSFAGIYALGSAITARNCLISNCGTYNVALAYGGAYEFIHCTLANYFVFSGRQTPLIAITNFIELGDEIYSQDMERAYFGNCIIYGSHPDEVGFGDSGEADFNYYFDHCLVRLENRAQLELDENRFVDVIFDKDPNFKLIDTYDYNFELDTLSPAKDAGSLEITNLLPLLQNDLLGNSRLTDNLPDLGVYERIE